MQQDPNQQGGTPPPESEPPREPQVGDEAREQAARREGEDAVARAQRVKEEARQRQAESNSEDQSDYEPEDVLQQVGDPSKSGVNRANATLPQGEAVIREDAPLADQIHTIPNSGPDVGEDEMAEKMGEDLARGFRGAAADPTPNEHYSVGGVTRGAPTPETHGAQRAAARDSRTLDEGPGQL